MTGATAVPRDADAAVTALFRTHYPALVRLAVLLVDDDDTAEDLVQDAFARLHRRWGRLRDADAAYGFGRTPFAADPARPTSTKEDGETRRSRRRPVPRNGGYEPRCD